MTNTPNPASHAANTAPISADLRGIEQPEYPPLPAKEALYVFRSEDGKREEIHGYDELNMWAYVDADRAQCAAPASPAQQDAPAAVAVAEGWVLAPKKLPAELIQAALVGHYGKRRLAQAGGPDGMDMTVNDVNYSGADGVRRMWRGLVSALLTAQSAPAAPATQAGITLDFKMATELLDHFGGEPGEVTLMQGAGHSGEGVYASYTDMPEEGASFLGVSDCEAVPAAPASQDAQDAARAQHDRDSIELRRLCQERDQARRERDLGKAEIAGLNSSCAHLGRLVDDLQLKADRYDFLRDRDLDAIKTGGVFAGKTPDNIVLNGDDLDAAIDAALAAQQAGGTKA